MDLKNEIEVNAPVEAVWEAFNDAERIAPCLPGAKLEEIEGDEFRGIVKVKVGPITVQYKGQATFSEVDKDNWKVVIKGDGRDTRGAGNASALITATMQPLSDTVTHVSIDTDLTITGKIAQFGRGAIADVSTKLMGQFADNLEGLLEDGGAEPDVAEDAAQAPAAAGNGQPESTDPSSQPAPAGVRKIDSPEPEAVDLLEIAGTPVLKRIAVPAAVILLLLVLRRVLRGD
ncbi:MAG: SRPBCC family protein [Acidimicrobiales bacterium]